MSKQYKVYRETNYIRVIDTTTNELFNGTVKDVFVDKSNTQKNIYRLFNVKDLAEDTVFSIPDILKANGSAYSVSEWEAFYTENTGNFNGGGTAPTNLSYTPSPTQGTVTSDTGTDATIPLADGTNAGLLKPTKFTVLENTSGVNTGDQDLSGKANINSPSFTGTPTAPTATVGTNTTQIATTAFVLANAGGATLASELTVTPSVNGLTNAQSVLTDHETRIDTLEASSGITTTPLTYGRVSASSNLASKSFVSTGVGTTVDFTATAYSSGATFSGTNGIIPSATGKYRASYYLNVGSDETAYNGTILVVQGGVSLGSVYINQHNSAGSVNQSAGFVDVDVVAGTAVFLHYQPDTTELVAFDKGSYFQIDQLPTDITVIGGGTITDGFPKLHSSAEKLKFVMYWPRLSPNMDWWKELDLGNFTWTDVANDLDQIKSELGVNAVRVFTYYDHQFRQTGTLGWTDGLGNHNPVRLAQLQQFIELAKAKDLDVIITMYQLLPALMPADNWNFLENDIAHYSSFHTWLLNGIKNYSNITCYNLINEPDGHGVFADASLGSRVLTFLNILKKIGKTIAPNFKCIVNTTTHDNSFRRFPNAPADAISVYDLTDVLAQNSFRWADTGEWSGTNFQTQLAYLNAQNILQKPLLMTECGFPANYAQQGVVGYPVINENGTPTGGNYTATEESIVPQGNIFDRPFGVITGMAHNQNNQAKSVGEAVACAERYDLDGIGAWSAYDHSHPTAPYVYRDPFGLIDKDGVVLPAGKIFKYALTEKFPYDLKHKLSLSSGTVGGDARINGLGGYNTTDLLKNTPNGVYLGSGGSYWDSGDLAVGFPSKIQLDFTIREAYVHQEPMIVSIITAEKQLDFRYKVYTVNSWQRINATNGDVDRGWASNSPILGVGNHSIVIDMSTTDLSPTITIDGVLLNYTASGIEPFDLWMLASGFRVIVRNNSEVAIDLEEMCAVGDVEGEDLVMNRNFATPIKRELLTARTI